MSKTFKQIPVTPPNVTCIPRNLSSKLGNCTKLRNKNLRKCVFSDGLGNSLQSLFSSPTKGTGSIGKYYIVDKSNTFEEIPITSSTMIHSWKRGSRVSTECALCTVGAIDKG